MAVSEQQIGFMIERLPHVTSLRELAREMRLSPKTVLRHAGPFIAVLTAQGALPPCACGRPRFHTAGCSVVSEKVVKDGLGNFAAERRPALWHRRNLFLSMLESGARYVDIDAAMGAIKGTARSYARRLTPEQQERRDAAIRAREENAHGR